MPLALVSIIFLAGCSLDGGVSKNSGSTSTQNTGGNVQENAGDSVQINGDAGKEPTIVAPKGNPPTVLVSKDLIPGSGAVVAPTSTLTVQYKLMTWSDGKIVDSSWTSGKPATFPLAQVIPGWQQGLPGMKAGGRRLLVIPPSLGYGATGAGPIKANETLIFVVDLIEVK